MRANGGRRARRPRKVKYIPCGRYQIQFLQTPSPVSTTCAGRFARDVDMSRYEGISSQSAGLCPHNRQLRHLFFRFCKSWFLNPHSHSMASVLPSRHSSCTQFSVPPRAECRQVTPCRVSSALGTKAGTALKTFFQTQGFEFLFLSQRVRRGDAFASSISPKTPVLKLNRPFARKPPATIASELTRAAFMLVEKPQVAALRRPRVK